MTDNILYYAILRAGDTAAQPSGLARRTATSQGRLDETFRRDFTWKRDSAIYEWERGEETGADLVEISEAEARAVIEQFREKWGRAG